MAESAVACFHCGEPCTDEPGLYTEQGGQSLPVCCNGCKAVSELIFSSGLDRYYQFRQEQAQRAPDDIEQIGVAWQACDERPSLWGAELSEGRRATIELPLARQVGAADATFRSLILSVRPEQPIRMEASTKEMFENLVSLASYALLDSQSPEFDMPGYALLTRWSCQDPIPEDYTLYMHYVDDAGDLLAQDDHLLGRSLKDATLPTSTWDCPGYYTDLSHVPQELVETGQVNVAFGLWIPATGQHLQPSGDLHIDQFGKVRLEVGE